MADSRAIYEIGTEFVEKGDEVLAGTKELLDNRSPGQVKLREAILTCLRKEFSELTQNPGIQADQAGQITSAVDDALTFLYCQPIGRTARLNAKLDQKMLTEHLVQACEATVESCKDNSHAHQILQAICETAFDGLAKNQPEANKVVLAGLGAGRQGQGDKKLTRYCSPMPASRHLLHGLRLCSDRRLKKMGASDLVQWPKADAQSQGTGP